MKKTSEIKKIKFDDTEEKFYEKINNYPIDPILKLIAFYLPQFHPFPENDLWWGKGFTEWSNVGKALPNYEGHYQPHCPIHFGYYDLRVPSVMEEQAKLAKEYGIYGFSYYFYWFGGKVLMDLPLEAMLNNPKIDMPFCFTWANENWSRKWDGQENDVLIAQRHSMEDSKEFITHLVKYFKDKRYILIDGKPLLIIYRPDIIPDIENVIKMWREEIKKFEFDDLYLVCAETFGSKGPEEFKFDASVQFPPHQTFFHENRDHFKNDEPLKMLNDNFSGDIFSYEKIVENEVMSEEEYKVFPTVTLSWDNTARKQDSSVILSGFSLLRYKQWLSSACNRVFSSKKYNSDEKIVFINAWNEWAEGTHLEPDRKYGYGYLQSTYDVISSYDRDVIVDKEFI